MTRVSFNSQQTEADLLQSFSYGLHSFTDRRQEKALGGKLYNEILRLWNRERETADLPTLQSGILLGLYCCAFGNDRLGSELIMRGSSLYCQAGFHEQSSPYFHCRDGDSEHNMTRAHKLITWGIYDVQA